MSYRKQVNVFLHSQHCTTCPSIDSNFLDLGKSANFPYATIDPEAGHFVHHPVLPLKSIYQEARIPVPDTRFDWLCELYKPASRVPAHLTCIDIAGLTAVTNLITYPPGQTNLLDLGRFDRCWAWKRVPFSCTSRRWYIPGCPRFRRRGSHTRGGRRRPHARHGDHSK